LLQAGRRVHDAHVIAVVIEDWKWRMVTPKTAVYRSLREKKP
jgi:hypothetical protein